MPSDNYKCWEPDAGDESDAWECEASDAEHAAEMFASHVGHGCSQDYPGKEALSVVVLRPDGGKSLCYVDVDFSPTYTASTELDNWKPSK